MKKLLTCMFAISALSAVAEGNNLYIGAGAGAGWNSLVSPSATFRLDGGYNFNDYWAVELGTTGLTQSGGGYNQSLQYYDASIKGILPLGSAVDIFAQVGGAYGSPGQVASNSIFNVNNAGVQVYQSSWDFMSAVGIDFNLTRQVSLGLSDIYYYGPSAGITGNTNVLLGNINYKF